MRTGVYRVSFFVVVLSVIAAVAFAAGFAWSRNAHADEGRDIAKVKARRTSKTTGKPVAAPAPKGAPKQEAAKAALPPPKMVYPEKTELDFEGLSLQAEIRRPGEFYFQRKEEEKFDSLVKRRPNFHPEMLRDVVLGK